MPKMSVEAAAAALPRVLVLAPMGRDAAVISQVLAGQRIRGAVCANIAEVIGALHTDADAAFMTEDALQRDMEPLKEWIDHQPPWSDFPFVVLVGRRQHRPPDEAMDVLAGFGGRANVILLERPLNAETMITAARSALRARARQYEAMRQLQAEAQLRQAEQVARNEASNAGHALSVAVEAGELGTFHCPLPIESVDCNARCRKHFNLPDDWRGLSLRALLGAVHPDDVQRVRHAFFDGSPDSDAREAELRTVAADGTVRWVRAKGRIYRDATGTPIRFDGVTIDVTTQKLLEREREALLQAEREARREAERAGRMKDEFISTLSHELRTPLSAILGWTYLLKRGGAAADVAKAAETIERNARAQAHLIEDLLDLSRIASGNIRLDLQPVSVVSIFEAVQQTLRPTFEAKRVDVRIDLEDGSVDVLADANRLQQIIWNIVANAVKFTPEGGSVRMHTTDEGQYVALQVSDTGMGIEPGFLPYVFDRFRQAESSEARSYGGLGLGLAIVRQLVEMQGGTVEARSAGRGSGATFVVRLPAGRREALAARSGARPPSMAPSVGSAELASLRVLVVDDENDGREMLALLLNSHGAEVSTAASAEAALALLNGQPIDLLISDIAMPHADGYQLIRTIRRSVAKEWRDLPAIALTAFARTEDAQKAYEAGYQAHLAKPFHEGGLLASINQLIGRR
jgi:signal transduction histidine kinase